MSVTAYPLAWPASRPRTETFNRKDAPFGKRIPGVGNSTDLAKLSVREAIERLQGEVGRLGATNSILSSNIELRLDGWPRSDRGNPSDPGVALYFDLKSMPHCLPCDRYERAADNIAAVAKHIEATRSIERYGVADTAEMFAGFAELPAPDPKPSWRSVLGFARFDHVSVAIIEARFRTLAKETHPDAGGSSNEMAMLNAARDEALREVAK